MNRIKTRFHSLDCVFIAAFHLFSLTTFHLVTRENEMLGSPGGLGAMEVNTRLGDGPSADPQKTEPVPIILGIMICRDHNFFQRMYVAKGNAHRAELSLIVPPIKARSR